MAALKPISSIFVPVAETITAIISGGSVQIKARQNSRGPREISLQATIQTIGGRYPHQRVMILLSLLRNHQKIGIQINQSQAQLKGKKIHTISIDMKIRIIEALIRNEQMMKDLDGTRSVLIKYKILLDKLLFLRLKVKMSETFSKADYDYVKRNESGSNDSEKAYQAVKKPHHPGNPGSPAYKNSGVTISYGIDLGNKKPVEVAQLLKGILVPDQIQEIVKGTGLKGDQAKEFVKNNKIQFSASTCDQIFEREIKIHAEWIVKKFNSEDMKRKYGIKNGNELLRKMPDEYRRIILDTKYWGKNTPSFRERIIPKIIAIASGKFSGEDQSSLNKEIEKAYESNRDRHGSYKLMMENSQGFKENAGAQGQLLAKMSKAALNPESVSNISQGLEGKKALKVGGVDLSFDPANTYFDGFYQGKKQISLHRGCPTDACLKDMIIPLKIMYDEAIKNKLISVSLDPNQPTNPDGPQQRKIYYPQEMEGTYYGQIMIQADMIMKQMKMGIDYDQKPFRYPAALEKVGLTFEGLLKHRGGSTQERTRQWIVIQNVESLKVAGNRVLLGEVKMGIEARVQVIGDKGTLVDSDQKPSKATELFCELFTEHYDIIANEYPQFAILKRFAKASILARSMLQKGCQINYDLINRLYELEKTDKSQKIVPTLVHNYYYEQLHANMRIMGGCDLTFDVLKKNQNPQAQKELADTDIEDSLSKEEAEQYEPFFFQSATICHVQDCSNICDPDYYSVKNVECSMHSRMKCSQCFDLIVIGEPYKDVLGRFCHARCFRCTGCENPIDAQCSPGKGNEYYHSECLPKVILGTCDLCKKDVTSSQPSMRKGEEIYLHRDCLSKMPCTSCQKQIPIQEMKYVNDKTYHKSCVKCHFCQKVIEDSQFKIMADGFAHPACVPKVDCFGCKQDLTGKFLTVNKNTYHLDCLKCKKCQKVIDTSKGLKMDKEGGLFHAECP